MVTFLFDISGIPTVIVYSFGRVYPILFESSIFRWADTMLQLNSLANPLLYFYRNRCLRKAALELLRCKKPQRMQSALGRQIRQRRFSVASLDAEEFELEQKRPRLTRSQSYGGVICSDTVRRRSNDTAQERPISAPSTQQHNKQVVTVQIETAPRKKRIQRNTEVPKDSTELKRSQHRLVVRIARSTSLHENSFFTLNCQKNSAEKNFSRSRSLPILSTTLNTLENKLTFTDLTNEPEPAWNSYEETKL